MRRLFSILCGLALLPVLLGLAGHPPPTAHAEGAFVVNTSADSDAPDAYLSLREAMRVANGDLTGAFTDLEKAQLGGTCTWSGSTDNWSITGGCGVGVFDDITFSPSITQVVLAVSLPILTDAGTFINGNAGVPRIDSASVNDNVFTIAGDHIAIANLTIVNGYNTSNYADIRINSGKDARVAYNHLGMLPNVGNCVTTGVTRHSYNGVYVAPNSSGSSGANNGVAYIYGNIIGCHSGNGVHVFGADWVYVGVQPDSSTGDPNYIGLSVFEARLANGEGVFFEANGTDGVRYGAIQNNQIWYNLGNGIYLQGTGSNSAGSTTLNYIKTNTIYFNGLSGLRLSSGAYTNFIGGGGINDGNYLGYNGADGVTILNSNNNLIQGNGIGVNGPVDRGNDKAGVYLENASSNTLSGNAISANDWAGVWAKNSNYNTIKGNKIGTTLLDDAARANGHDGIALTDGAHHNTVGGEILADRNVISGNTLCGVRIRDGSNNNTIDYNLIGLNAAGTDAIPNGQAGVCVFSNSNSNGIGSSLAGVFQYISGNLREGVYVENSVNLWIGPSNQIGVAVDNATPRGNALEGIMLNGATNATVSPARVINNGGAGIAVIGATAYGNRLEPLIIRNNGGMPIDLGNDGPTPNDPGDTDTGSNTLLNYPVITFASGTPVTLTGTACANCTIILYRAVGNPAAPGGGGTLIGLPSIIADGAGNWSATLPAGVGRLDVTAQARDGSNNTSEFSPRGLLFLPLIMK